MNTQEVALAKGNISGVQYLRGYAAISVVVYHMSYQWLAFAPRPVFEILRSGVDVFFVISGFVMVYSTETGSRLTAAQFMARRLIKIAPLYWIVTTVTLLVIIFAPEMVRTTRTNFWHALGSYIFIPIENPGLHASYPNDRFPIVLVGWTLVYEMFFYSIFALSIFLGRRNPIRVIFFLISFILSSIVSGFFMERHSIAHYYCSSIIFEFLLGSVVAIYYQNFRNIPNLVLYLIATLSFVALVFLPDTADLYRPLRFGIPSGILLLSIVHLKNPTNVVLYRLGDLSYSLYLTHFLVQPVFSRLWRALAVGNSSFGYWLFLIVGSLVSILAGYVCWRFIERPATDRLRSAFLQ